MDNLKIQLTPLEVTYQSKDALPLSCVLKKVVISTGQLLQKREIKSNSNISAGRVNFTEGTTFALSKEMEMTNTKISMHFMAKKDRNISCIGSAQLDIATIPNQTFSLIELKLSNCSDPRGKLKLQIERKQEKIDMKKDKQRIQNVGLLQTEGVQRESILMNRRINTNVPTAYQISRRNYKQTEIVRDEKNSQSRKHGSSKGSYQKKFQTATAMTNQSRSKNKRNEIKTHQELPMPRQTTPEPISIQSSRKTGCIVNNNIEPSRHLIAGRPISYQQGLRNKNMGLKGHEEREEPSYLVMRPYQQRQRSYTETKNDENVCNNSHCKLQQQKNSKYRLITEKLQMIHDKIVTGQSKDVSEAGIEQSIRSNQQHHSIRSNQQHQSLSEQVNSSFQINTAGNVQHSYNQTQRRQNTYQKPHSHSGTFQPFKTDSQSRQEDLIDTQQRHITKLSSNSLQFKQQSVKKREVQMQQKSENKFANIPGWSINNQWHENSPKSTLKTSPDEREKTKIETDYRRQLRELQKGNEELGKQNESYLSEIQKYQRQIAQLKNDIIKNSLLLKQKDQDIYQLTNKICESDKSLNQKQALLDKINNDYDAKFDQVQNLKDQLADIQNRKEGSIIDKIKEIPTGNRQSTSSNSALIQEELIQTKKKLSEMQVQLRSRQNELKLFKIQMEDIRMQKRGLEQQIQSFYRKNFKQISRQRSIALIQEASISNTNLILQNTKRENDALKQEIKLLQQNKQAINRQLQPYKNSANEIRPIPAENRSQWQTKYEERIICLEERCRLLEEQLKNKKNVMAEMVNIIWKHGDADIMNDITQLMGE